MKSPLCSFPLLGVVSVCFDEDEDRNLCLIAYPLKGDHGTVDSVDNSDCEPKSKLLRRTTKKHPVLETEKSPKDWVRQHWKEEKTKRWVSAEGTGLGRGRGERGNPSCSSVPWT